jgi:hypothetical protein
VLAPSVSGDGGGKGSSELESSHVLNRRGELLGGLRWRRRGS